MTPEIVELPMPAMVKIRFVTLSERFTVPPKVVRPVLEMVSVLFPRLLVIVPLREMSELPPIVLLAASVMVFPRALDPPDACRVPPFKVNNPAPRAVLVPAAIVPAVNVVPPA